MTDSASPQPYHVNPTLQSNYRNSSTIHHRTQALFGFLALVVPAAVLVLALTVRMGVAYPASPLPVHTGRISSLGATSIITPTNEWVNFYSQASYYYGQLLPVGAVVRAHNPRGVQAGEFVVTTQGWYGLMLVYRDDPYTPEDEGLRPGEEVSFTINGMPARPDGPDDPIWTSNGDLKQVNLIVSSVKPTNEWVNFYSQNTTLNGQPVPVGTLIEAFDPQGTRCGESIVNHAGWYGLLLCYRDDPDTPEDEGAEPGDAIAFRVAGAPATASGPDAPQWTSNGDLKEVNLTASTTPTSTSTTTLTATPTETSTPTATATATSISTATPTETEVAVPCYDFDHSGTVDSGDIQAIASAWRNTDAASLDDYDFNHNHIVDVGDIQTVAAHWGEPGSC